MNGYVPGLMTGGQVVGFLAHREFPIPSTVALGKIGNAFRQAMARYAEANGIPWLTFAKGGRKIDVVRPYLEAAERDGRSRVVAIGAAREFQWVWDASKKDTPASPWFAYYRAERLVTCYYAYIWDDRLGPGFIKICSYAPYPVKVWVNGHEAVRRMAAATGLPVTPLANGFASSAGPAALQNLCDQLAPRHLRMFFERWMARLPLPLSNADRAAGYWWELSIRQIEVSRTLVLDAPRHARAFFEALVQDNLGIGRPDEGSLIFDRQVRSTTETGFATRVVTRGVDVTVNCFYKHSRIKQYLKEGRAIRVETVCNSPTDLGCQRRLVHLDQLQARARAANRRLLDTERAGPGCVLASPAFARVAQPTGEAGCRTGALRFGDPRVMALAGALCILLNRTVGFTHRSLR